MSKVLAIFNDCLKQVQSWVKELKKMLGSDISLVIAGNKVKAEKKDKQKTTAQNESGH